MAGSEAASNALQRALTASAAKAGFEISIGASDWVRWDSATFEGARHVLSIDAPNSSALGNWLGRLDELELGIKTHLLADIAVVAKQASGGRAKVHLKALTVQAA